MVSRDDTMSREVSYWRARDKGKRRETYVPVLRKETRRVRLPGQRRAAVAEEAVVDFRAHVNGNNVDDFHPRSFCQA